MTSARLMDDRDRHDSAETWLNLRSEKFPSPKRGKSTGRGIVIDRSSRPSMPGDRDQRGADLKHRNRHVY